MLATVILGFVGGMGNLLGSLRLSENGLSPSGIGVLFSLGALVWIFVAPMAGRLGERRSHVALTAVGCALSAPPGSCPWPTARRLRSPRSCSPPRPAAPGSTRSATCSPARGAESAGAGRGAVIGLVNLSWGVAAVIGPLAASAAHGSIDERIPFGVIAMLCLTVATLLFAGHRPTHRGGASPGYGSPAASCPPGASLVA